MVFVGSVLALGLLGQLRHPFGTPQQSVQTYSTEGWTIAVERDGFTGRLRCGLQTPRRGAPEIRYAHGALAFYLGRRTDTLGAWYRTDGGPAKRWQDLYPALVQARVSLDGPSLDNPAGGVVLLPRSEVVGAREVTIRASARAQPRTFKVRGFSRALEAAKAQGCTDDTFVR